MYLPIPGRPLINTLTVQDWGHTIPSCACITHAFIYMDIFSHFQWTKGLHFHVLLVTN